MPDWDDDSPELRRNLAALKREIVRTAQLRRLPTIEMARRWQRDVMTGLAASHPKYVGAFRGGPGLETTGVRIDGFKGVHPANVAEELKRFEDTIQALVARLDGDLPPGKSLTEAEIEDVLDVCAWTHAEWVRIHPFANGNGRTARLWADFLACRYGLAPFVPLRPRPDDGYEAAGARAMQGDWRPTAIVFRRLFARFSEHLEGP